MAIIKKINHDEVEGVRFGKYNLADNSTVLIYKLGDTIIDSGPPNQWKEVKGYLAKTDFKKVVLTHHHEDHSGNSARISGFYNTPVYIHESGIEPVKKGFSLKLYQKIFWGKPKKFTPEKMPGEITTGDGHTLKPIYTPGHSFDHVCFFEPEKKWLFTGDLFLAKRPKLFRADEDLQGEIESLKAILEYDFQTIFCAHKGVVTDGYKQLQDKLDYFISLVGQVKEMNLKGNSTREITHSLFGKKDSAGMVSFKHFCYENLIKECLKVKNI